jgi:DNA-binding MarR family transcriptional regulator
MTSYDLRTVLSIVLVVGFLGHAVGPAVAVSTPDQQPDPTAEMVVPDGQGVDHSTSDPPAEGDGVQFDSDLSTTVNGVSSTAGEQVARLMERPDGPPSLFVAAAYSRSVTSEPLDHDSRRELFEAIHARPGVSRSRLGEATGLSLSTIRYHVEVLESVGMVESHTVLGRVRIAEVGVPRAHVDMQAALTDDGTAPILAAVAAHETPSQSTLVDAVGRAPSTVSYHVDRLVAADLLERERTGRRAVVRLTDRARSVPITTALSDADATVDPTTR